MSNIQIASTTDSNDAVMAATGQLAPKEEVEIIAPDEKPEEPEESNDDNSEIDKENDEEEEERPKKKGGFKRRIEKLNSKISQAEQEREYWKQEALKAKQPDRSEAKPEGKPSPGDFETHDDYVEALTDWKLDQKLQAQSAKQKESQIKSEQQARIQTHLDRIQSFVKEHEDFEETMMEVDDVPISIAVQELILESENGPELMYELAKNRKEFEKICKLSPLAAARAMGAFEAKLGKQTQPKTTKAPPPIRPVGSKASAGVTKSPDEMDFQEYKRWRAQHPSG